MTTIDFSHYLEFASRDPRYDDARSLYTETGALLTLEARRVDHDEIEGSVNELGNRCLSWKSCVGMR